MISHQPQVSELQFMHSERYRRTIYPVAVEATVCTFLPLFDYGAKIGREKETEKQLPLKIQKISKENHE